MKAKKYLLFFLLGYCIYIAIEVTYRGYSFRLMGIAGGLSLAGIGMLEDAGLRRFPLAFQMMVSAVLITAIELYSGMFSLWCCITVCGTTVRCRFPSAMG